MKWKIVADSGCDIKIYETGSPNIGFENVPLSIDVQGETFIDDLDIDIPHLLDRLKESKKGSSSAAPAPGRYAEAFKGAENVICFTLSSALSGSYNSAVLGAELVKEENPMANIHVFDSKSAGAEENLLVVRAMALAHEDVSFNDMVEQMNAYHQRTNIVFMLQSVDNLRSNGRVSWTQATLIGLLGMRLIGRRTSEGAIELSDKARGERRGITALMNFLEENHYQNGRIELSHSNSPQLATRIEAAINDRFKPESVTIRDMSGLCNYYAERGGIILGFEDG